VKTSATAMNDFVAVLSARLIPAPPAYPNLSSRKLSKRV